MLRYRLLLIDTEGNYRRPVQMLINELKMAEPWIVGVLATAGKDAYIQVYKAEENEFCTYKKSDIDDKGTVPRLQPAAEETNKRK